MQCIEFCRRQCRLLSVKYQISSEMWNCDAISEYQNYLNVAIRCITGHGNLFSNRSLMYWMEGTFWVNLSVFSVEHFNFWNEEMKKGMLSLVQMRKRSKIASGAFRDTNTKSSKHCHSLPTCIRLTTNPFGEHQQNLAGRSGWWPGTKIHDSILCSGGRRKSTTFRCSKNISFQWKRICKCIPDTGRWLTVVLS